MLRRCLTTGMAFAFIFMTLSVCADGYELQYKALDLRRGGIYTSGQFLRPTTRSEEKLSAEPQYRSNTPIYAVAEFGNGPDKKHTIVLDESKGTGRGYDILYFDRNNNEDLTDDPGIVGRADQSRGSVTTRNFGPVEVMIDYDDRTAPYYFSLEFRRYGQQRTSPDGRYVYNVNLRLYPSGYYTGVVSLGGSEYQIAAVDFNGNGLFNEYFKPRSDIRISDGRLYAIGDHVLVDVNGDGRFEPGYTGSKELYYYAKYLQVNGKWYSLNISDHGGKVEVQMPSLRFGAVSIPNQPGSCSVQLASEDGILRFDRTGKEFQVPTGAYQLYSHATEVSHSSGKWRYNATGTASGQKLQVAKGNVSTLRFGAPLFADISYSQRGRQAQPRAGDTVYLSLAISGQGGEIYSNITKNGQKPKPAPTFKVVDEKGRAVASGTFEYG